MEERRRRAKKKSGDWGKLKEKEEERDIRNKKINVLVSMMARVILPFWTLEK